MLSLCASRYALGSPVVQAESGYPIHYDVADTTALVASNIIYEFISMIALNKESRLKISTVARQGQ